LPLYRVNWGIDNKYIHDIRIREQQKILSLFGSIEYDEKYDYKRERKKASEPPGNRPGEQTRPLGVQPR
jgi:hypothetical protein